LTLRGFPPTKKFDLTGEEKDGLFLCAPENAGSDEMTIGGL